MDDCRDKRIGGFLFSNLYPDCLFVAPSSRDYGLEWVNKPLVVAVLIV